MAYQIDSRKIRQGTYILCCSEEESKNLLAELEKIGYSWNGEDDTPMSQTYWDSAIYGKIAYYIRDERYKKIQYRISDFGDIAPINYQDVVFEVPSAMELSIEEKSYVCNLLERAYGDRLYLVCHDESLMRAIVDLALEYEPGNVDEWENITDFNSFDTIYFDMDGYLIQTFSKSIPKEEKFVFVSKKLLQTNEGYYDDEALSAGEMHRTTVKGSNGEQEVEQSQFDTSVSQLKSENNKRRKGMNIFGMNMEFGLNTDENITSTFIGVAVKNGESWRVYDKKKKTLTDIGDMSIGSLPLFIMPSTKLEEGDLIKNDGGYYYVVQVNDGNVKTLSAATGKMEEVVPVDNILGVRFYSKVIVLAEDLLSDNEGDGGSDRLMMAMAMSSIAGDGRGQNDQMLLPLLLLKDKGDGDDKKADRLTKLMLDSSMCGNGGGQNSMLPLLFLKGDLF